MGRWPKPRVDPEVQAGRDRVRLLRLENSPAGRYYPTRVVVEGPILADGSLDVRAWLRQLDDHSNGACGCSPA